MSSKYLSLLFLLTIILSLQAFSQQKQVADQIVAVVNDRIILKSEIDNEIADFMREARLQNRNIEFTEELWYSALESMIDNYALLERAKMDSVVVGDEMVNRQMDLRIRELVRQAGSEQALEEAFGKSLIQLRSEFRDQFREQMITQRVRQNKMRDISITRPEVEKFFNSIPTDSLPTIPEQVAVSHIVVIPPSKRDDSNSALQRAIALRDSVTIHGMNFEEMARKYSEGPSAPNGGHLTSIPISDLVANYSAAATALSPGEISEVVETRFGYHVIRLNQRLGDKIDTNHILITIDEESLDEDFAIQKLEAIRDSVINHGKSFSDMARKYSDDDITKSMGGRIINRSNGARTLRLDELDPSLYRIVLVLEEGEISEPRPFNPPNPTQNRAYRIVRIDQHIPEHVANLKDDYDNIENIALEKKQLGVLNKWIDEIRNDVYIEYKIDVPESIAESIN